MLGRRLRGQWYGSRDALAQCLNLLLLDPWRWHEAELAKYPLFRRYYEGT